MNGGDVLFTDEDQNTGCQRQNPSHDHRDCDVEQSHDSNKNQVDSKQEHSEVFSDVHGLFLRHGHRLCTLKVVTFSPAERLQMAAESPVVLLRSALTPLAMLEPEVVLFN